MEIYLMKTVSLAYLLIAAFVFIACSKPIGEISDDNSDEVIVEQKTVIAPTPLNSFSCVTGNNTHGTIECNWSFPTDISNYQKFVIKRKEGVFSTADNCLDGDDVYTSTDYTQTNYEDLTPSNIGEAYSYRACVYDLNGNASSYLTSSAINALDIYAPVNLSNWSCSKGTNHGEIDCNIDFPDNTEDFASFSLIQLQGYTAPNSDCVSDGTVILNLTSGFTDQSITIATGSNVGESYSYRFCSTDNAGNMNSDISISNVQAQDIITPSSLDSFTCSASTTSIGQVECNLDFPVDTSDYYSFEIWRLAGAIAPNADCGSDGTLIYSDNGTFSDVTITDDILNENSTNFSYRACVRDSSNQLESSLTQLSIVGRSSTLDAFSCLTGSGTIGNIDCTLDFPIDTSTYSSIKILRIAGAIAPNIDCISDGTEVFNFTTADVDQVVIDATGSASGTAYSYRVCTYSTNGRLINTDQTALNILSF
jgi:hypothetical protein